MHTMRKTLADWLRSLALAAFIQERANAER